ncbi:hypothetical protein BaRGS_00034788 [Batillaria attramentaria]|uniref:Uncharacterized protein n=1 Tax=Batillaria attramentaria TaxID=370345 RepID=A0ABD0JGC3_9CAEN|nr:hypothetical protein BaRGS_011584 [Batillaria attramentaria]
MIVPYYVGIFSPENGLGNRLLPAPDSPKTAATSGGVQLVNEVVTYVSSGVGTTSGVTTVPAPVSPSTT